MMKAVEISGTVDERGQLHQDEPVSVPGPGRVRIIVLFPDDTDIDEREWLRGAASNPAFDFLKDAAEDIYSLADGKPFNDKG